MTVTVADRLAAARHHARQAERALRAVSTTAPGLLDLCHAVAYLIEVVRDLDREARVAAERTEE